MWNHFVESRFQAAWCFHVNSCTPDLKPIIGKSKIENLFIATGHYRNGVLFSAITSDLLLKIVQNKSLKEIEKSFLEKFSLDRFAI